MEMKTEKIQDIMIVQILSDVLEAHNAKAFKKEIHEVIKDAQKVIFDLNQVSFIDSSGCGVILSCIKHLKTAGGDLKLFGVAKEVMTLFELIRMHRIIDIYLSKEDAIQSFMK